jgi:hypothetical protein
MKRLLIVYHTQFGATRQMAEAAAAGGTAIPEVATVLRRATDAGVDDLLAADALLVATSENFGGMAGMIKDFLERVYYPCADRLAGRAYSTLVCAGTDGLGGAARRRPRRDRPAARARASGRPPSEWRDRAALRGARRRARAMRGNRSDAGGRTGDRPVVSAAAVQPRPRVAAIRSTSAALAVSTRSSTVSKPSAPP